MKKIVVTGAAGFIGSHMVDLLLDKGYKVIGIDNLIGGKKNNLSEAFKKKNFVFLKEDINKISNKHKILYKSECVFHFAGLGDIIPSIDQPKKYVNTNINGTINMLEMCRYF